MTQGRLEGSLDLSPPQLISVMQDRIMNESTYFGIETWNNPTDFWIFHETLYQVNPDVIIEIGNHAGGSTLALAHLCDCLGHGRIEIAEYWQWV